jgi:hypothetical protein
MYVYLFFAFGPRIILPRNAEAPQSLMLRIGMIFIDVATYRFLSGFFGQNLDLMRVCCAFGHLIKGGLEVRMKASTPFLVGKAIISNVILIGIFFRVFDIIQGIAF